MFKAIGGNLKVFAALYLMIWYLMIKPAAPRHPRINPGFATGNPLKEDLSGFTLQGRMPSNKS